MQYECKITVLETKVFADYQEKYLADPKSGPCPCFKAGDTFLLKRTSEQDDFYHLMNGKPGMRSAGMYIPRCRAAPSCAIGQMTTE